MILGLDVWSGYGKIDWRRVYAAGFRFVYVKCTEGNEVARDDRRYYENVTGAKEAGLYVGAYHFSYPLKDDPTKPGRSPEDQARRAYITSGQMGTRPGELPPALDAEWPEVGEWGKWGVTAESISEWLRRYCIEMERLCERKPLLYTYPFWWRTLAASTSLVWARDYPLWVASYKDITEWQPKPGTQPHELTPWDGDWTFWQFAADKSPIAVPGIPVHPVDRNVFRGDLDALRKLAGFDPDADTEPDGIPRVADSSPPESTRIHRAADWAVVHPLTPLGRPALDGELPDTPNDDDAA